MEGELEGRVFAFPVVAGGGGDNERQAFFLSKCFPPGFNVEPHKDDMICCVTANLSCFVVRFFFAATFGTRFFFSLDRHGCVSASHDAALRAAAAEVSAAAAAPSACKYFNLKIPHLLCCSRECYHSQSL